MQRMLDKIPAISRQDENIIITVLKCFHSRLYILKVSKKYTKLKFYKSIEILNQINYNFLLDCYMQLILFSNPDTKFKIPKNCTADLSQFLLPDFGMEVSKSITGALTSQGLP